MFVPFCHSVSTSSNSNALYITSSSSQSLSATEGCQFDNLVSTLWRNYSVVLLRVQCNQPTQVSHWLSFSSHFSLSDNLSSEVQSLATLSFSRLASFNRAINLQFLGLTHAQVQKSAPLLMLSSASLL
jgi:hypothetical protein